MFEETWKKYPADSRTKGSKAEAEALWHKLSASEQLEVWQSLDGYADHLAVETWRQPMMVRTYLAKTKRRWEPYLPVAPGDVAADEAACEARTAAEEEQATGWQPIETAPKDKKWLLLHGDGTGFMKCTFIGYWGTVNTIDPLKFPNEATWRQIFGGTPATPTHWQPLPAPPGEGND
jgi:hypothetical protein